MATQDDYEKIDYAELKKINARVDALVQKGAFDYEAFAQAADDVLKASGGIEDVLESILLYAEEDWIERYRSERGQK